VRPQTFNKAVENGSTQSCTKKETNKRPVGILRFKMRILNKKLLAKQVTNSNGKEHTNLLQIYTSWCPIIASCSCSCWRTEWIWAVTFGTPRKHIEFQYL